MAARSFGITKGSPARSHSPAKTSMILRVPQMHTRMCGRSSLTEPGCPVAHGGLAACPGRRSRTGITPSIRLCTRYNESHWPTSVPPYLATVHVARRWLPRTTAPGVPRDSPSWIRNTDDMVLSETCTILPSTPTSGQSHSLHSTTRSPVGVPATDG